MFTGIIESLGEIRQITAAGANRIFWIASSISEGLQVDQSLSHDGVCMTVEKVKDGLHRVTAIAETQKKTNLGSWKTGDLVNLERSMVMNGRLDGHIVQGHADCTGVCLDGKEADGSWEFRFEFPKKFSHLVIEKGSISINGISLTIFDVKKKTFRTAIIPYTYEHTNVKNIIKGSMVNIEFDLFGKYISRLKERFC